MSSIVTVSLMDNDDTAGVTKLLQAFDEQVAPRIEALRRRQVYSYCGLCIHMQDWDLADESEISTRLAADPQFVQLDNELALYCRPYTTNDDGSDEAFQFASRFYLWPDENLDNLESLHCAVIVNRVEPAAISEVHRLFAELDATDFPNTMGTLRRQIFHFKGVYLHIQDFEQKESKAVIGAAWKEADPRFLKIVADLTPIVPPYNPEGGQLATRFYHWARHV